MEKRISKIIVGKAGGTAGKSSKTYKVSLPTKWVSKLNLTNSRVEMHFDGEKITITPHLSLQDFVDNKNKAGHQLLMISFYNEDIICTKICADFSDKTLAVENYTDNIIKTAFGNNITPTWFDLENFLEERCVPKSRSGIREYLETIGVESYNSLKIIEKTEGRMAEDSQWIKLEEIE